MSILAKYNNKLKNVINIYTHSNTAIKSVYDNNNNIIWGTILPTYVYIDQLNGTTIAKGNPSIWNQVHENEQNSGSGSGQGSGSSSEPGDDPSNPNPGTDPGSGQSGSESGSGGESGGDSSSESFKLITYTDPYYFKEYKIKYNDTPKTLKQTNNLLAPLTDTSFWILGKIIYQNQIVDLTSQYGPGFLSDFIEVQSSQEYLWYSSGGKNTWQTYNNYNSGNASSGYHFTIAQFDSEKNYVGNTLQGFEGTEAFRWTTPANVKYIRVSFTQPRNCMCLMKTGKEFSLVPPLTDTKWSKTLNTTNNTYTYSIHIKLKPKSFYYWNFVRNQNQSQDKTIYLYRQESETEYTTYRPIGFGSNLSINEGVFSTIVYNTQPYDDIDTVSITINNVNENNLPQFYIYERSYTQKGYILPIKIKPYGSSWQFYECILPESVEAWDYVHYKSESTSIAAISPFSQTEINRTGERTNIAQYNGRIVNTSSAYQYPMSSIIKWYLEQTSLNQVIISGYIHQYAINQNNGGYLLPLIYYDWNKEYLISQSLLCVTLHNLPRVDTLGEDFYIKIHFDSRDSNAPAEMLLATKQDIIEHPDYLNKSFTIAQNFTCQGAYLQFFGMCTVDRLIMDMNFLSYGSSPAYHSYTYYHKNQLINLSQLPALSTTKNMTKIDVTTQPKPASFVVR